MYTLEAVDFRKIVKRHIATLAVGNSMTNLFAAFLDILGSLS